ncbi:MAG: choice-of-anchor tandem repeat GloVer-containing protein [Terriglobia bacterium]|jgi:uncharacterized repeat protein (TIGR03803 family)
MDKHNWGKRAYILFLLCAITAIRLPAQTLTTLHSFDLTDGAIPYGGLVQGSDGSFYGTTSTGGANTICESGAGCGTVFKITSTGTLTTLYSFCSQTNCTDGNSPIAGLVQGSDGNFYGTTVGGGAYSDGTVFKITPSGTLTTLHSFTGSAFPPVDGAVPEAGLVQGSDGNFYGTARNGGSGGDNGGTVFKITPDGTLTTLYSFCSQSNCTDGLYPYAGLVQGTDGNFYGTTNIGGANNVPVGNGTVFKITPSGALTTLYSFCSQSGCTDGNGPSAGSLVQATDGNFYGTTGGGGATDNGGNGTVFKITPSGTLTTLYSFCSQSNCTDGALPTGLVQATDGNFYGTTYCGGANAGSLDCSSPGAGTVFKITPSGALTTLYSFCSQSGCTDGVTPYAGLVQGSDGNFYGTTNASGGEYNFSSGYGTVFKLTPPVATGVAGVAPPSLTFSSQIVGTTSAAQPVTLSNTGSGTLTIASIAASANFGESDTCAGSVVASGSCTINVTFSPTGTGTLTGMLTITDNSNGVAGSTQTVSLSGTGTAPVAGVSPPSLTFSSQIVGTTSASQPVTLSNTGAATLTITSIATSANYGETNTCAGSVAASSSCTINVTFSPTATGTLTGTLTIADNSNGLAGSMQTVSLSGTGIGPGASVSPASMSFGDQVIRTTSAAKKVTLTSTGTANLNISSFTIAGTNAGDFAETNNCPASMAPAAKCTISLTYTPTVLGAETASLAVTDNAANSPQAVALSGTGESPVVLGPTSLSFGNVGENSPSASKSIKLTNNQAVPLSITSITLSNPDYTQTNTCNGSVAAKGNCTITVTLTPTVLGADTGTLTVNDNASNTPQTATLTGTGVVPAKLSATSLSFGNVPQSTASTSKNITLTNDEALPLTIASITIGNPDFTETNTCDGSVPSKGNCVITVTFTPSMIGAETGTLSVSDAASNSPQTATLTGTGIAQAAVSPASLTFAALKVGNTSAAKNVTLTNNLSTALTITSVAFTGADLGDFAVSANTCGASLAANSKCTISVTFTPGGTGTRTATMAVMDSANDSPQSVFLTGTGIALSQTITFGALANQDLGNPPFPVGAIASSGLPVIFASVTPSVCTVSGVTVTLVAVGTCAIQAMQPGNADYAAATPVVQRFEVTLPTLYTISAAADNTLRHQLGEINPANGAFVQQFFASLPVDAGIYWGVGGLAFGNGSLWAISAAADNTLRHQLWEINPANGALVQQFFVSLPVDAGIYWGVGGLAFGNGSLWAISAAVDNTDRHQLWEINPANGGFVQQFFVSLPADPFGVYLGVGGLAWQ